MDKLSKWAVLLTALAMVSGCNDSSSNSANDSDAKPELPETPDVPETKVRKSLMVMIDGARYEALLNASTPNLDKLVLQQAYTGGISGTLSQSGTSTVEGESTLWTGSWHNVQKSGVDGFKTVWQHLKADDPEFKIGLYPNWPIFDYLSFDLKDIEHKQAFRSGTDREAEHVNSKLIAEKILTDDYNSLFTTIDMVDYSGHCYYGNSGGAWSHDYIETIEEADEIFGYMLDAVEQREAEHNEEWLVLVAPDHGFNRQNDDDSVDCSHGSQDIDAKKIWIASNKKELLNEQFTTPLKSIGNRDKDGIYRYVAQTDVSPTLLTWHDVALQPQWEIEGTSFIGDLGVRGLFVENAQENGAVEIHFTASNSLPVQVLLNGEEIQIIENAVAGEVYTFQPKLDVLEEGSHQVNFTLINNNIPKSVSASVTILDSVDYDDLPFESISAVYSFDGEFTENSVVGGHDLQKTGEPQTYSIWGKYDRALYHIRQFNNDLLLEDTFTNTDKFTFSLWFAGDGTSYDPAIITNKHWSSSADGIILAQLNNQLKLQVGANNEGSCCFIELPFTASSTTQEWNLLVVSVDKTLPWSSGEGFGVMTFGVYDATNVLHMGSVDLTGPRKETIHTGLPFLINNDHAQSYNTGHAALIDELVIWNDQVFTPGAIATLAQAEHSVVNKLAQQRATSTPAKLTAVDYIGASPNLTEAEQMTEAFWQRRRQMDELKAKLN
ncbi:hypothetical protein [Vibrio rarus]|uniref:hypothetical protein n=1 Tax=Vibrio rarus TaxID=413403 RepID=UPI0021C45B20|nr:hypothetical protein [Vibrio rarus]